MDSVHRLQVLRFIHLWHKGLLPDGFGNMVQYTLIEKDHLGDRSPEKDCC